MGGAANLTTYHTQPPAKINLFLETIAKRTDGYHELDTVMVAVDLCDDLELSLSDRPGIQLDCQWMVSEETLAKQLGCDRNDPLLALPSPEDNLVTQALERFRARFSLKCGWKVRLRKRIPSGAGLGGASSDAASAIMLAAQAVAQDRTIAAPSGLALPELAGELHHIASEIGSDVPFFLGPQNESASNDFVTGSRTAGARATGRGEKLEFLDLPVPLHFAVIYPAKMQSTAQVYGHVVVPEHPQNAAEMVAAIRNADRARIRKEQFNRLQEVTKQLNPAVHEALSAVDGAGIACAPMMTGSGSACFMHADTLEAADSLAKSWSQSFLGGCVVHSATTSAIPAKISRSGHGSSCVNRS
ncbi:MAG: 4-(cytidine 5'-diphospho)-2-C-methyl-D-erythritol kinase [Planctomycetota bacterium]